MSPTTHRGWAYGGGSLRPAQLPGEEEAEIEVRWRDGRFRVHGSPWDLEAFAAGYLVSEGLVPSVGEVRSIKVARGGAGKIRIQVRTRRQARSTGVRTDNVVWEPRPSAIRRPAVPGAWGPSPGDLLSLAAALQEQEPTLRSAGHLHWAALYDPEDGAMLLASDLSRHSAVDKVLGKALLAHRSLEGHILYTTGRIGEEMGAKAVRAGVAALVTRSVAFRPAVELARRNRLVLVGKLSPEGFWLYAGKGRLARRA